MAKKPQQDEVEFAGDEKEEILSAIGGDEPADDKVDRGDDFVPTEDEQGTAAAPADDTAAAQSAAPADAPEAEPAARNSPVVPHARFNQINEELKAQRLINEQLMAIVTGNKQVEPPAPAAPPFDVAAARRAYTAALVEGDENKAIEIQAKIDDHIEQQATAKALALMRKEQQEANAAAEQKLFTKVAAEIEAKYPALNVNDEAANNDAIEYVILQRNALLQTGEPLHNALQIAVDKAVKLFGLDGGKPKLAAVNGISTSPRAAAQAASNAKAAGAQPAPLAGVGDRATVTKRQDVATMSDDEFKSLPAAERRRLRGD